jgi:hypothetical protein
MLKARAFRSAAPSVGRDSPVLVERLATDDDCAERACV